jgi:hypothetical protein
MASFAKPDATRCAKVKVGHVVPAPGRLRPLSHHQNQFNSHHARFASFLMHVKALHASFGYILPPTLP